LFEHFKILRLLRLKSHNFIKYDDNQMKINKRMWLSCTIAVRVSYPMRFQWGNELWNSPWGLDPMGYETGSSGLLFCTIATYSVCRCELQIQT